MTTGTVLASRSAVVFWASLTLCTVAFLVPLDGPMVDSALHFEWWSILPGDKLVHAFVFCGLMVLGARRLVVGSKVSDLRAIVLGLSIYAVAIEACQHVLPWRSFEVLDLVADGLGIVLGSLVAVRTLRYRRCRSSAEP